MQREVYQSPTGSKINLHSLLPLDEARAVVHITHGMAEHSSRYSRFALDLTDAGFAVFAHDMRGHGRTIASDAPQGVFAKDDGFSKVLEDQNEIVNLIKKRLPNKPIICFGKYSLRCIIGYSSSMTSHVMSKNCKASGR